jgi:hypothetical protein
MDFQSVIQFASPLSFLQTKVETKKVRVTLDFPTGAIADGRYLDVTRGEIDLPIVRYFHPIGSANYLTNAVNSSYVPPGPLEDQYVSLDWNLFALRPRYNGSYDPGLLIELLFGDEGGGPSASLPEAAAINQAATGLIIGLAVGLSLFAIAAVSVTVVMVKVAPFRAKREKEEKTKVLTDVDETPLTGAGDTSPRWTSGAKPT